MVTCEMRQDKTWLDLRMCWFPPPEGVLVQAMPAERDRIVRCYFCQGAFWDMMHKRVEVRWWRPNEDHSRKDDAARKQYSVADGLLQEIIEKGSGAAR